TPRLAQRELRQPRRPRPHPTRLRDEPLPDASVLPHDPPRSRGGREARRGRILQDVPEGDAAPGRPGARRGRDPHLPGNVERPVLAGDPAPGPEPVHDSDRDRPLPLRLHDLVATAHGRERARASPDPVAVRRLPTLLRRGRRSRRGEGMTLRRAFAVAAADAYHQAWRLIVLNTVLGLSVAVVVLATFALRPAILLAVLVGPLVAAVMHCAAILAQPEDLRLAEAMTGRGAGARRRAARRRRDRGGRDPVLRSCRDVGLAVRGAEPLPPAARRGLPARALAARRLRAGSALARGVARCGAHACAQAARLRRPRVRAAARERRRRGGCDRAVPDAHGRLLVPGVGSLRPTTESSPGGLSTWQASPSSTSRRSSVTPWRSRIWTSRSRTASSWSSSARRA